MAMAEIVLRVRLIGGEHLDVNHVSGSRVFPHPGVSRSRSEEISF